MESFAGLLQRLVILQVSQCFMEVDARFLGVLIRNTNIDTNDNQPQLLNRKDIKHRSLVYLSKLYANERYFLLAGKVIEANRDEISTILSQILVVVDLPEE